MKLGQKNFDQIQTDFERQSGWLLRNLLVNHQYLIRQYLPDYPTNTNLTFKANAFDWIDFSDDQSQDESDVFFVKAKFVVSGDLIIYKDLKEVSATSVVLNLIANIPCRHLPKPDMLIYNEKQITVMNEELSSINSFEEIVMKEFDSLTQLPPINRDLMDQVWQFVDRTNEKQVFISGWDYLNDVDNVYRQTRYLIALARTYKHFANRYFESEVRMPTGYHALNFTSYDRRYLDYCTHAIQSLYVYWERIAFLIFQFYQPKKLKEWQVSFNTLIKGMIADQKAGENAQWFEDFFNNDHKTLQALRHPLVHYEFDSMDLKGGYVPKIHSKWIAHNKNSQYLKQLEADSRNLLDTITNITEKCAEGYARTIGLILDIKK